MRQEARDERVRDIARELRVAALVPDGDDERLTARPRDADGGVHTVDGILERQDLEFDLSIVRRGGGEHRPRPSELDRLSRSDDARAAAGRAVLEEEAAAGLRREAVDRCGRVA